MASNISISLKKYSFTETPDKPFEWEHETSPGLTLTFSPPHLKVTIGRKVLDSVDVHRKVQQTKAHVASMQANGAALRSDDLPISAMSRPYQPALGILYRKSMRKIRRLQLTFNSMSDTKIAFDLVLRSGVKMFASKASTGPSAADTSARPPSQVAVDSLMSDTIPDSLSSPTANVTSAYPSSPPGMRRLALQNSLREHTSSEQNFFGNHNRQTFTDTRGAEDLRPSTAPLHVLDSGLTDMLPPRRALPFSLPGSRDSGNMSTPGNDITRLESANNRPSSSSNRPFTANLPPLKSPTYASTKQNKQLIAKLPLSVASPPSTSQYFTPQLAPTSSTFVSKGPMTLRPSSSSSVRPLIDIDDSNERSLPRKRPCSRNGGVATNEISHPEGQASKGLTDLTGDSTQADASRVLESYATQPQNIREDMLNELLMECIEDDAFTTLCQDVAANWRRIGLGLQ